MRRGLQESGRRDFDSVLAGVGRNLGIDERARHDIAVDLHAHVLHSGDLDGKSGNSRLGGVEHTLCALEGLGKGGCCVSWRRLAQHFPQDFGAFHQSSDVDVTLAQPARDHRGVIQLFRALQLGQRFCAVIGLRELQAVHCQ